MAKFNAAEIAKFDPKLSAVASVGIVAHLNCKYIAAILQLVVMINQV